MAECTITLFWTSDIWH